MKNPFSRKITKEQTKDTGMAMVLIVLIIFSITESTIFCKYAILLLVLNMINPVIYYPVAIVWFGISHLLGSIMSKILLSIIFFSIVTPMGLFRRLLGKDDLHLKAFKKEKGSAMKTRNHLYTINDIDNPY